MLAFLLAMSESFLSQKAIAITRLQQFLCSRVIGSSFPSLQQQLIVCIELIACFVEDTAFLSSSFSSAVASQARPQEEGAMEGYERWRRVFSETEEEEQVIVDMVGRKPVSDEDGYEEEEEEEEAKYHLLTSSSSAPKRRRAYQSSSSSSAPSTRRVYQSSSSSSWPWPNQQTVVRLLLQTFPIMSSCCSMAAAASSSSSYMAGASSSSSCYWPWKQKQERRPSFFTSASSSSSVFFLVSLLLLHVLYIHKLSTNRMTSWMPWLQQQSN